MGRARRPTPGTLRNAAFDLWSGLPSSAPVAGVELLFIGGLNEFPIARWELRRGMRASHRQIQLSLSTHILT